MTVDQLKDLILLKASTFPVLPDVMTLQQYAHVEHKYRAYYTRLEINWMGCLGGDYINTFNVFLGVGEIRIKRILKADQALLIWQKQ